MIQNYGYVIVTIDEDLINFITVKVNGSNVIPIFKTKEEALTLPLEHTDGQIYISQINLDLSK